MQTFIVNLQSSIKKKTLNAIASPFTKHQIKFHLFSNQQQKPIFLTFNFQSSAFLVHFRSFHPTRSSAARQMFLIFATQQSCQKTPLIFTRTSPRQVLPPPAPPSFGHGPANKVCCGGLEEKKMFFFVSSART